MHWKTLKKAVVIASLVLPAAAGWAQSTYSNAIVSLNAAGYWPMHEVEAAAPGDIETNYGTLGLLGTAYYPDWATPLNDGGIKRGATGALANDSDQSVDFDLTPNGSSGPPAGTFTNALYVPHTSPLSTLNPPFSVECWFYPVSANDSEDIWGQNGFEGLNNGSAGAGQGKVCGIRLVWENNSTTGFELYSYKNSSTLQTIGFSGVTGQNINPINNWYHLVVTCDAQTNLSLYTNGVLAFTKSAVTLYSPDYWTPITIGGNRGGTKAITGNIDEFAVYTNVITDVYQHYSDGINESQPGTYVTDVKNDNAAIYLRMDAPGTYVAPANLPALKNYGQTNGAAVGNGIYSPGTMPGVVAGPANPAGLPLAGLSGPTVPLLSGISSFGDAGSASIYNPTGSNASFAVTALFHGNPCDNRVQSIVGHGTNSWQLTISTSGSVVFNAGNGNKAAGGTGSAAGDMSSAGVYNDGFWHQVVAVDQTNVISLYVDGQLNTNGTPSGIASTNIIPGNALDVMIGADPNYTNIPAGAGRQFAGQICDVAFFTNAVTFSQVQSLFNAAGILPYITRQPVSAAVDENIAFTNIATVVGSGPLVYQWYTNGVAVAGQTNASLIFNPVTPNEAGTNYYLVITNNYGSTTSAVVSLAVYSAPSISAQYPVTYTNVLNTNFLTLYAGANPTFSISAAGLQPISYYWFTNGTLDSAASQSSLTCTGVQIGTLTAYCLASNSLGSITSAVWSASVIADPLNSSAGLAPYPQSVLALDPIGYWRLNEGNENGSGDDGYVTHDYAGGNDGIYTNVILGNNGYNPSSDPSDTSAQFGETGVFIPVIDNLVGQIQGVDFGAPNGSNAEFTVEAWVDGFPGTGSQIEGGAIATKGLYGTTDEFNLGVDSTKVHYRFYVRSANGTMYVVGSGTSPAIDGNWHHLVGVCDEANGLLSLYYDGQLVKTNAIPPGAGLYEASNPLTIGAATGDGTNYTYQFYGNINDVAAFGYALSANQIAVEYSSSGTPPSFAQVPPTNMIANGGGVLTIPASVIGTAPLSYQWTDVSAGTNIVSGTTNAIPFNATLTVSNVPAGWNNDKLELTINNTYGSTNVYVSLTVYTNSPVITQDLPAHIELLSGTPYNYSVSVTGPTPYSYQWYGNGAPIFNQTNAAYTATAGSAGSSSTYYVIITNTFGATTSSVSTFTGVAQLTTPYATNVLGFHPVGYWPLQETNAPAPVTMETNYGTLGKLGNAYYAATNASNVGFALSGAIAGDSDTAVAFGGGGSDANSYAFVPRISPLLTIQAPFSLECWVNSSNAAYGVALGEGGGTGLNGDGIFGGFQMGLGSSSTVGGSNAFQMNYYTGAGNAQNQEIESNLSFSTALWYHYVVTYDGTNSILYVNGQDIFTATSTYAVDTWSPLAIGAGKWDGGPIGAIRWFAGQEDEVAVYTNVLTEGQITNHYLAGTTVGSNYMETVLGDTPLLYYRMDCPGYTNASENICPIALNFGSAPVNGVYLPGTVPGELSGPQGLGTNAVAAGLNGVFSCVNAGNDPSFNTTGSQPFTALTWFRTYPSDGRVQDLISHGTNWALVLDGTNGDVVWDTQGAGPVLTVNTFNDDNWHMAAGVYDGTHSMLYIDGQLNNSAAVTASQTGDPNDPVYLGGNAAFAAVGNNQQYFAGALAQAAFYTNALTAAQIAQIYSVVNPVNTSPTQITFSLSNGQLTLSWPANHTGWTLQSQTDSVSAGLGGNWVNVPGSTSTNQVVVSVNPASGCAFYRLIYNP